MAKRLLEGKKVYQEDIFLIAVELSTKMTYRDTEKIENKDNEKVILGVKVNESWNNLAKVPRRAKAIDDVLWICPCKYYTVGIDVSGDNCYYIYYVLYYQL